MTRDLFQSALYQTIAMDPPWPEHGGGKSPRGADHHYATVPACDMARVVRSLGGWNPDPVGCSIWCWTTVTSLPASLALLDALGARYVSHCVWTKAKWVALPPEVMTGPDAVVVRPQAPGLGQHFRCAHEMLLFAAIGTVPVPPPERRLPSVIFAPRPCYPGTNRPRHSAKPAEAYRLIETHDGPGRRAELFARNARAGWDIYGAESPQQENHDDATA